MANPGAPAAIAGDRRSGYRLELTSLTILLVEALALAFRVGSRPKPAFIWRALVAGGRLHARGSPLGPASHRRNALCVEPIGDRLKGHAAGAHAGNPVPELGVIGDGRRTFATGGFEPLAGALSKALALPGRHLDQHLCGQLALPLAGVQPLCGRNEPRTRPRQPAEHLPKLYRRAGELGQFR